MCPTQQFPGTQVSDLHLKAMVDERQNRTIRIERCVKIAIPEVVDVHPFPVTRSPDGRSAGAGLAPRTVRDGDKMTAARAEPCSRAIFPLVLSSIQGSQLRLWTVGPSHHLIVP